MNILPLICVIFAFVCAVVSAAGLPVPRINLLAAAFAFYMLSLFIGQLG